MKYSEEQKRQTNGMPSLARVHLKYLMFNIQYKLDVLCGKYLY